jgi:hypothetical protein
MFGIPYHDFHFVAGETFLSSVDAMATALGLWATTIGLLWVHIYLVSTVAQRNTIPAVHSSAAIHCNASVCAVHTVCSALCACYVALLLL